MGIIREYIPSPTDRRDSTKEAVEGTHYVPIMETRMDRYKWNMKWELRHGVQGFGFTLRRH